MVEIVENNASYLPTFTDASTVTNEETFALTVRQFLFKSLTRIGNALYLNIR